MIKIQKKIIINKNIYINLQFTYNYREKSPGYE